MRILLIALVALLFFVPARAADLNQSSWSEVDGSNTAASPNGWAPGMLPSAVEPTGRQMMGAIKRAYNHVNCTATTAGSPNAQTVSYSVAPQALVAGDTFCLLVGNGLSNTAATTLNINGLGAKPLVTAVGTPTVGGELIAGQYALLVYDGGNFRVETFTNNVNGTLFVHGGAITLDNGWPLYSKTTGGIAHPMSWIDNANELIIGDSGFAGAIRFYNAGAQHALIDTDGTVYSFGGTIATDNSRGFRERDIGGIYRSVATVDGSNNLLLGDPGLTGSILLENGGQVRASLDPTGNFNITGTYRINGSPLTCGNLSNAAASCSVNTTNAANISSGTLPSGRLSGGYSIGNLTVSNSSGGGGGNIGIDNGSGFLAKDNGGNYRFVAFMDVFNNLHLGDNTLNAICFHTLGSNCASFVDSQANIMSGNNYLATNGHGLYIRDTGSTLRQVAVLDSNNNVDIGSSSGVGAVGVFTNLGSCAYSSGSSWSCSSDARLKQNISWLDGGAAAGILRLRPISYAMRDDSTGSRHLGFTAQDVQQAFPQLVSTMSDGTLSLEYTGLIAPLVATVQAQQKQIDTLTHRLDALEAKANAK